MENILEFTDGQITVSTLIIAKNVDRQHKNIIELIRDNIYDFKEFGRLDLKSELSRGQKGYATYYKLNEQQYSLLMTYFRNNPKVKEFKKNMVKAFFLMKNQLETLHKGKDLQKVISGLKSGMSRKDKKIQRLEDELEQLKIEHKKMLALPNFTKDEKLEIIMKKADDLLKQNYDSGYYGFLQNNLKFYKEYIEVLKSGGSALEKFAVNQIEEERRKRNEARDKEVTVTMKYNNLVDRIQGFIEASNKITLLKKI
ncbi:Rha family transcriptional regulator [Arcobacter sp.]|uniref:Rha family transcriptional regulator n=1 Tax=unclassified Arcobacter TaxID=2593671 RepID=UPI003AFF7802|eukprot:TRINITY_DN50612_c0_g1_i2.p1 TRINITY_DN50612_c0_g1~~TRINITY_DN50612_c0_g1_i2.p1  ORF type:complete len:255 (+),score=-48.54 TRINITY_DN50612_c0_g1_i2:703-1467(+)